MKNPVAAWLEADTVARPELPIPREQIDFDHRFGTSEKDDFQHAEPGRKI